MKIFAVFGLILIAVIISASFIFTLGMYRNIGTESNTTIPGVITPENESATQYETQYAWQVVLGAFAVIAAIIGAFWLVLA